MKPHARQAAMLLLLSIQSGIACAGTIFLKTELWPFICKVEVAVGADAPVIIDEILEFPGVRNDGEYIDGVVFEGQDRLCYRRSSIVDDCHSALNDWVCYSNSADSDISISIY